VLEQLFDLIKAFLVQLQQNLISQKVYEERLKEALSEYTKALQDLHTKETQEMSMDVSPLVPMFHVEHNEAALPIEQDLLTND